MRISGYRPPEQGRDPVYRGRLSRGAYTIEKWALYGEGDYVIPVLLFKPEGREEFPAVIFLHPQGKAFGADAGGPIEQLMDLGYIVAAADPIGTGETAITSSRRTREVAAYTALLIGRSLVGIQAGDISRVVSFLQNRKDVKRGNIRAMGYGELCPALLHAASFNESIGSVALIEPLLSYRSLVTNRFYEYDLVSVVASALKAYDLPDLAGCIAPRKLLMVNMLNHLKQPASDSLIAEELSVAKNAFLLKNCPESLLILNSPSESVPASFADWWLN